MKEKTYVFFSMSNFVGAYKGHIGKASCLEDLLFHVYNFQKNGLGVLDSNNNIFFFVCISFT